MNFINYSNNIKPFFSISVLIIFGLLPVSLILGNLAININIVCANLLLIIYSILFKDWDWVKDKFFKLLLIIQIYLIFSSTYAIIFKFDHQYVLDKGLEFNGLYRSISFLKYLLLIFSFSLIKKLNIKFENLIKIWSLTVLIVIFDVFYEKIFGHNILGYVSPDHTRIVSFFKDELVVGSFILCFGSTISLFWISRDNNGLTKKLFINLIFILVPISIFISGERSNFLKSMIIFSFLFFYISETKFIIDKKKLIFILVATLISLFYFNNDVKQKYSEFFQRVEFTKEKNFTMNFQNISYFSHYSVAWKIFKDNPLIGAGSKNFRWECHRSKYFEKDNKYSPGRCSTHPHQVHLEILSEQGIIGYILIIGIIFIYTLRSLIKSNKNKEVYKFSIALYIIVYFTPLLPSGSLFSTFGGSNLWIILGLLYYLNNNEKNKIL
jgi:O-antigen ligase